MISDRAVLSQAIAEKLWSLDEMERTGGNRVLLVKIKTSEYIFFMIVQRKVLRAVEVFIMTVKRGPQEKNTSQKVTRRIWPLPWALSS